MQEIMQFVGRHPMLSIAWIALLVAVLVTTFKSLTSKVKVITRGEATRLINKEDAVVVDLRQRDDFRKGHIAGSINLLPTEIKANNVGELDKHKDKPVIVVDGSGMQCRASKRADESWVCASICAERRRSWLGWRELASGARQIIYLSFFMPLIVSCNYAPSDLLI